MIRLAFSTNAFKKNSLDEAVSSIAQAGYAGVELMADVPHAYPPAFSAEQRKKLKQRLHDLHLAVSNINAFTLFAKGDTYHPTWIEADESQRRLRIAHTLACIDLAAEFGAPTVSLQPGGPLIGGHLSRNEAAKQFAQGLSEVLPRAHQQRVTLAVEPEPGLLIESSGEYLEFKNKFFAGEERIKMNCDIGHLFCVGEDPAAVIGAMPEQIAHVHLEDIGENRVHQHLTPGKGAIDFRSVFSALNDIAYTGRVTVELYPYETTAAGVAEAAFQHLVKML